MAHFVVDHRNPFSFAEIDPPALPVFRMNQMDPSVLEGLTGSFTPIDVLVPFDARELEVVETAEFSDRFSERKRAAEAKKIRQISIDRPALAQGRENHSQGREPP
jgi:hypothetical protein